MSASGNRPITRSYARAMAVSQLEAPATGDETLASRSPERQQVDRLFAVAMLALLALTFWVAIFTLPDAP